MASYQEFAAKPGVNMSAAELCSRLNFRRAGWELEIGGGTPTLARTDSHDVLFVTLEGEIVRRISWSPDYTIPERRRYPTIEELDRNGFEYRDDDE